MSDYIDVDFSVLNYDSRSFNYKGARIYFETDDYVTIWVRLSNLSSVLQGLNTTVAAGSVSDDHKEMRNSYDGQYAWHITIEGLRGLVRRKRSGVEEARAFMAWVDDEVLPIMREPKGMDKINALVRHQPDAPVAVQAMQEHTLQIQESLEMWKRNMLHMITEEVRQGRDAIHAHFDDAVKAATKESKEATAELHGARQRLADLEEELEQTREALVGAQRTLDLTYETHKMYTLQLNEENRNLQKEADAAHQRAANWKRRAVLWGRRLYNLDEDQLQDDVELYKLSKGELDD